MPLVTGKDAHGGLPYPRDKAGSTRVGEGGKQKGGLLGAWCVPFPRSQLLPSTTTACGILWSRGCFAAP